MYAFQLRVEESGVIFCSCVHIGRAKRTLQGNAFADVFGLKRMKESPHPPDIQIDIDDIV